MKTVLSLLALSLLSTACGTAEVNSYRFEESNVKNCIKGDWGGCVTERPAPAAKTAPVVKKEPKCPKKAKPEVIVFDESEADKETEECVK